MDYGRILAAIAIMAAVTYLPRVLPLALFRRRIENPFLRSFLLYMPYGVLAAMVFPEVLYSTGHLISGLCGGAVALLLSYRRLGLLPVALAATATVFVAELILKACGMM